MLITDIENRKVYITQVENPLKRLKITGAERQNEEGVSLKKPKFKYNVKYTEMLLQAIKRRSFQNKDKRRKAWQVIILKPGQSPYADKGGCGKNPKRVTMGRIKHIINKRKYQGVNKMSWKDLVQQFKQKKGV